MFLRYLKEIDLETAEKLRTANETLSFLNKINDLEYLCAALEPVKEVGSFFQKLTPIVQPEYEIFQKYSNSIYQRISGSKKKQAYINCGNSGRGNLVSFALTTASKMQIGFYLGQFMAGKNELGGWVPTRKCLLAVTQYFFNRFDAYKEIYNLLVEKQKELRKAVGSLFSEDLIALFSVDKLLIAEKIDLSLKDIEPQVLGRKARKRGSILIGTVIYRPKTYFCGSFYLSEIKNELWLTEDNQLILEAFPKYRGQKTALIRMEEVKKDKEFSLFLDQQIGKWLEAIITEADFGKKLYEKNKTNILVGTI